MKTRRDTLKLCLGALAGTSLAQTAEPLASRFVDTHTHFYDPTRPQGVPWPAKGSPLDNPAYPKDWLAVASPLGVRETIVVECSKLLEDNDWILNLAAREKSILGFIGRLQPGTVDFTKELKRLAANPLFRGIRVEGNDLRANAGSADYIASAKQLADMNLVLEVNGLNDLELIAKFADSVTSLQIVLDHVGNSGKPDALRPGWKDGITALAKRRNVVTKVSALVEFARKEDGTSPKDPAYYLPVLN
ncbi:MAG: amidohydrolase 2, partial [Verrucomicrobiaceae bacterium]|nr:amidohydrolase 2 [Verrucomicrobiaceae bacterium]